MDPFNDLLLSLVLCVNLGIDIVETRFMYCLLSFSILALYIIQGTSIIKQPFWLVFIARKHMLIISLMSYVTFYLILLLNYLYQKSKMLDKLTNSGVGDLENEIYKAKLADKLGVKVSSLNTNDAKNEYEKLTEDIKMPEFHPECNIRN